jgi:hypothetical protein
MARARHARPSKMRTTARAAAAAAPVGVISLAIAAPAYAAPSGQIQQANQIVSVPLPSVIRAVRAQQPSFYTVKGGDSLSGIAQSNCGTPSDWMGIYVANKNQVRNPDEIYPGQHLALDCRQVQGVTDPGAPSVQQQAVVTDHAVYHGYSGGSYSGGGTLSYAGLEVLWEAAGGPASAAPEMAVIALKCESGGRQYAYNPSGASGYWQILGQVVPGDIFNPMVNAENAVKKFRDAGGFSPWRGDGCV